MKFYFSYVDIGFYNGNIITVNNEDEIAQAVGVKGNKIVFVGSTEALMEITDDRTKLIDLKGRTMCPGFIDTHFHPILNGLFEDNEHGSIIRIQTDQYPSIQDILDIIRKAASIRPEGQWISLMGYDQNRLVEGRHPRKEELDLAAPNHKVQCMRACGHIGIYNSAALGTIGVLDAADVLRYPKNEIVIEDGRLTGMVKEHTHFYLWSKVTYTQEQQIKAATKSNSILLKNGITSLHDPGECGAVSYQVMQHLCKNRTFKPRVCMMLHSIFGKPFSKQDNEHYLSLGLLSGLGDEFFRIGPSKFMIDGGTSGPSCATKDPYCHDSLMPGIIGWEKEEIIQYIHDLHKAGVQITAHAVGDLAIEYMVEGYEKAIIELPREDTRHRIEHCAIVSSDLIDRMAVLQLCPSCNPGFIAWNGTNYTAYFGERMKFFMAMNSMIQAGIKVSIGSDAPSGPVESMKILDACVNRRDFITNQLIDQTQCIGILEAVRAYTMNGAYASFEENIKGSIEVGKCADLVILSENLLQCPKEEIGRIHVDMTIIDGIVEYEKAF